MQSTVSVAKAFVLSPLLGSKSSRATKKVNSPVSCNATKKVNSYDEDWKKGFFGTGLFLEDSEVSSKSWITLVISLSPRARRRRSRRRSS